MFFKIGALKNFAIFAGKQFVSLFNRLRPATLLKKKLWHRCFPMKFAKFLRTPRLQRNSGGCFCLWKKMPTAIQAMKNIAIQAMNQYKWAIAFDLTKCYFGNVKHVISYVTMVSTVSNFCFQKHKINLTKLQV